jgi:hypothetical protein
MPKKAKKRTESSKIMEKFEQSMINEFVLGPKDSTSINSGETEEEPKEERKEIHDEITKELKTTFNLPKFGLKDRTMNVMARIDSKTSRILDALVTLELAPSRSAAAAYLIAEAIQNDKEKYNGILESYETIKSAKLKAQFSFLKKLKDAEEEAEEKERKEESESKDEDKE